MDPSEQLVKRDVTPERARELATELVDTISTLRRITLEMESTRRDFNTRKKDLESRREQIGVDLERGFEMVPGQIDLLEPEPEAQP